ncbi:hypothetical protein [Pseudoalteromonas sp. TB64]|uniref:hypothetical protein n=1 Tax=Pseudoalteromonas sp. TB64 TaxID=1938600 RepID=UPI00041767CF|nr:hypothetical protein [Pseudoalteromonas sp. TB64]
MINLTKLFFIISLLITSSVSAQVSFPDDSTIKIVSDGMIVDGVKMRAWDFKSKRSIDFNLDFFTSEWKDKSTKFSHVTIDNWQVINAVIENVVYTAKLRSAGKNISYGFIATSADLDSKFSVLDKSLNHFPKPSNTTLIREIKSLDGAKKSSTLIMMNGLSVKKNLAFYHEYYSKYNWAVDKSVYSKNQKSGVFLARNGPNNINIVFDSSSSKTMITVVRVDVE